MMAESKSMGYFLILALIGGFAAIVSAAVEKACSFNKDCQCVGESGKMEFFDKVSCLNVTGFPIFNLTLLQIDVTVGEFLISGVIDEMPPTGLDAFHRINHLAIDRSNKEEPLKRTANNVLANCSIDSLTLVGFKPLLPLSSNVLGLGVDPKTLGQISRITIDKSDAQQFLPLPFTPFVDATSLKHLFLYESGITDTSFPANTKVFEEIADTLVELDLSRNTIKSYPKALDDLTNLQILRLSDNRIESLTGVSLIKFPNLTALALDNNKLDEFAESIIGSDHPRLEELNLADNQLNDVPETALKHLHQLKVLSLANNRIGNLSEHAFAVNSQLEKLSLDDNPIERVEIGAFTELKALNNFSIIDWKLETFDLSVFDSPNLVRLSVKNNTRLHTINVSNSDGVAKSLLAIEISGNGLTDLDKSLANLLAKNTQLSITISDEYHYNCEWEINRAVRSIMPSSVSIMFEMDENNSTHGNGTDIDDHDDTSFLWLAQLAGCAYGNRIILNNVYCASNSPVNGTKPTALFDFLQELHPNCSASPPPTTQSPPVTRPGYSSTSSGAFSYQVIGVNSLLLFLIGLLVSVKRL